MNVKITPAPLAGTVESVGSKSFAHRALIAAALFAKGEVILAGITPSKDVEATVNCLRALGATIVEGETYRVIPPTSFPKKAVFPCIESGSTMRFFLPIAAALGIDAEFTGSPRLLQRPNDALFETLRSGGITVCENRFLSGKLQSGIYRVNASVSSQYITGMLFALALLEGENELVLTGEIVSREYVDITVSVLKDFGIEILQTERGYKIKGKAESTVTEYKVEGDWSNAAFYLVAGALSGPVTVTNLNQKSLQGDRAILSVLAQTGANITQTATQVTVKRGELQGFSVNAEQIPDAVPILAVLAAFSKGETQISGVERLKIKESDRLAEIITTLQTAGISAKHENKKLIIMGGNPKGGKFFAANDHRMAMMQTILAAHAKGDSEILGAECVSKSYPMFYEDFLRVGGNYGKVEG
ncbi:MAG: 3-phosphoshikimate 1-carboxyvinyltransferase [Clostridiales bacterium]|nr:3-phosphoshikimate 1-carboxyvinyltransferase [Clostridiales bacterium]